MPKPLSVGVLGVKAEVSVLYHLAEIDQRVSHSAECCIDAYSGLVCNLLETHFAVVTQQDYFFLVVRKFVDELPNLKLYTILYKTILDVDIRKLLAVEEVCLCAVGRRHLQVLLPAVMIDNQVMRDADHPREEYALLHIPALAKRLDHFDEGLLEYILRQFAILNVEHYVSENFALMTLEEGLYTIAVAVLNECIDELLVFHFYVSHGISVFS